MDGVGANVIGVRELASGSVALFNVPEGELVLVAIADNADEAEELADPLVAQEFGPALPIDTKTVAEQDPGIILVAESGVSGADRELLDGCLAGT